MIPYFLQSLYRT